MKSSTMYLLLWVQINLMHTIPQWKLKKKLVMADGEKHTITPGKYSSLKSTVTSF